MSLAPCADLSRALAPRSPSPPSIRPKGPHATLRVPPSGREPALRSGGRGERPGAGPPPCGLGDIYVNDAFSCAHRAHASTEAIAHLMPAVAGPLMAGELAALDRALGAPARPSVAIVGGSKYRPRSRFWRNLVGKVDHLIVGGGMANTFLCGRARRWDVRFTRPTRSTRQGHPGAGGRIGLHHPPARRRGHRPRVRPGRDRNRAADACPDDAMILDAGPQRSRPLPRCWGRPARSCGTGPLARSRSAFRRRHRGAGTDRRRADRRGRLRVGRGRGDTVAA